MELNVLTEALATRHNGTIGKIWYKSEMPLKAAAKKAGISITKFTEANVRFGVDYNNIATVIERKSADGYEAKHCDYDRTWLVENKVYVNNKTGKTYVRFANISGAPRSSHYEISDSNGSRIVEELTDADKENIVNSYWNRTGGMPEIQDINIDNVIKIFD